MDLNFSWSGKIVCARILSLYELLTEISRMSRSLCSEGWNGASEQRATNEGP